MLLIMVSGLDEYWPHFLEYSVEIDSWKVFGQNFFLHLRMSPQASSESSERSSWSRQITTTRPSARVSSSQSSEALRS